MNDDKKKYNNTYEKLAAFLGESKRSDEEEPFSSDEEARKLLYLWNECHPAGADAADRTQKTSCSRMGMGSCCFRYPVDRCSFVLENEYRDRNG